MGEDPALAGFSLMTPSDSADDGIGRGQAFAIDG